VRSDRRRFRCRRRRVSSRWRRCCCRRVCFQRPLLSFSVDARGRRDAADLAAVRCEPFAKRAVEEKISSTVLSG